MVQKEVQEGEGGGNNGACGQLTNEGVVGMYKPGLAILTAIICSDPRDFMSNSTRSPVMCFIMTYVDQCK